MHCSASDAAASGDALCSPSQRGSSSVGACEGAVVAFMDIRCASRAHDSVNVLDGSTLITAYNESSTTPAPVVCLPPANTAPLAVASCLDTTPPADPARQPRPARQRPRSPATNGPGRQHRRTAAAAAAADGYMSCLVVPPSLSLLSQHSRHFRIKMARL